MQELIKITTEQIGTAHIETVDARELHKFLGSKQNFSNWIRNRIIDYGFQKDSDFIVINKNVGGSEGGRPRDEYYLTINTGKELAMLERNEIGMQVRKYFIECEKRAHQPQKQLSRKELAQMVLDGEEQIQELTTKIEADKPKVEFATTFKASIGCISMGEFSKRLGIKDLGQNKLFEWMRKSGFLINEPHKKKNKHNLPYQRFIDAGYFEIATNDFQTKEGIRTTSTTMVTVKGQIHFEDKLRG